MTNLFTPTVCSGVGQYDSRNHSEDNFYDAISWSTIVSMAKNPADVEKPQARWIIPSTYNRHDARLGKAQRKYGVMPFLCLDIDEGSPTIEQVVAACNTVFGPDVELLVYASKSSRPEKLKWRAMLRFQRSCPAEGYETLYAQIITSFADAGITLDPRLRLPSQLVYLPNKGEHYKFYHRDGKSLSHTRVHEMWRRQVAEKRAIRQAESARREAASVKYGDGPSPLEDFNKSNDIETMLTQCGFKRRGKGWVSPYSQSGSAAVKVTNDNRAISLSGSDEAAGLGRAGPNGGRLISPFDLYAHFNHNGNASAALKSISGGA